MLTMPLLLAAFAVSTRCARRFSTTSSALCGGLKFFGACGGLERITSSSKGVTMATFIHFLRRFPKGDPTRPGQKWSKIFLLHESIDLDELYPTVPVSQIVTRRKYFSHDLRL